MSDTSDSNRGGIGFLGLLGILFIGLKLTGYIAWPWLWVTAPLWAIPAIILIVLLAFGLAIGVTKLILIASDAFQR